MVTHLRIWTSALLLLLSGVLFCSAFATASSGTADRPVIEDSRVTGDSLATTESAADSSAASPPHAGHGVRLVGSLTVFLLAVFVGFEVISKVPTTLHTPLMSGSNAISGITVIGAILGAGHTLGGFGSLLGMLALLLAFINVVGGFLVTHRMLMMFKKR